MTPGKVYGTSKLEDKNAPIRTEKSVKIGNLK